MSVDSLLLSLKCLALSSYFGSRRTNISFFLSIKRRQYSFLRAKPHFSYNMSCPVRLHLLPLRRIKGENTFLHSSERH